MAEDHALRMTCPRCGPERPLEPAPGPLRALRCEACAGAIVPFATSAAVRAQLPPIPAGPGPALACPSCGGALRLGTFRGEAFGACPPCAVLWLDAAPFAWATARAEAQPAPRPAPPPPEPPSRGLWVAVGGVALALLLAGGVAVVRWRKPAAAAPAAQAPAAVARPPAPAGPVEPAREIYGGRPPQWWEQRLAQLAARGDPEGRELREWTLGRARANGLEVVEEGGRWKVIAPGAALGTAK